MSEHVLLVGVSARAAAESAARAGFTVSAFDAFADRDLEAVARVWSLERDFQTRFIALEAATRARDVAADAVVYLANFENHPSAVARLGRGRALWGNPADVVRRVRDPLALMEALEIAGLQAPHVRVAGDLPGPGTGWLLKPMASGGGHGIEAWTAPAGADRVPRGRYLQERIEGVPGSVVFVAAGGAATVLAVTRQLVGEAAWGARGFRYCGSVIPHAGDAVFDAPLREAARRLAQVVTETFGLVGVNGVDFIVRDGLPWVLEVNPRWCASLELAERASGVSTFGLHAAACAPGASAPQIGWEPPDRALGKAIVFAKTEGVVGDTDGWLTDVDVRDIPHTGERLRTGQPVCTVFASGCDAETCLEALAERADRIYASL